MIQFFEFSKSLPGLDRGIADGYHVIHRHVICRSIDLVELNKMAYISYPIGDPNNL